MTQGRKSQEPPAGVEPLRRSEQRYRALVAATDGIMWIADAQGQIVEDLPAWRQFTGQGADDIKGDGWIAALHPDDRGRIAAFWSAAGQAGTRWKAEFRLRRHDGDYRHIALHAAAVVDAEGTIREWIGVGIDMTERKLADEELTKLRAQLAEQTAASKQHERWMALIDELNASLHVCDSLEEAYPLMGGTAVQLFPAMNGALALADRGPQLKTVAQWGDKGLMALRFSRDDCRALRRGEMDVLDEAGKGAACLHFTSAPKGMSLCLPLVVQGDTLGLLHLDGATRLNAEEQRLVMRFGDVIKIAVADLKLRETLRIQAIRDPLTGLFNRQYIDETLPRECQLAKRRKSRLSVAMLDIDGFKQFNDSFGHEAGDNVLRELGQLLRRAVRSSDVACRYGGDEFVLVLLDADLRTSVMRVEQICLDIKRRQCVCNDRILPSITVSVGLSEFPTHGRNPSEILRAADEALYAAKHAGRDRIMVSARQAADQPARIDT